MDFIHGFDKLDDIDNYSEEFQQSCIYRGITKVDRESLLEAIHSGENVNLKDNMHGINYLHLVVSRTSFETQFQTVSFIYVLSNAGICMNEKNFQNSSPIQDAIRKNLTDLVIALIRCGAWPTDYSSSSSNDVPSKCQHSYEMQSILSHFQPGLWNAVAANDYMSVSRLLSYWCRVRIQRDNQSLLLFTRECSAQSLIIEILENNKATMEYVHATLAGDEKRMLDILSNKNVDVYTKDMSNSSLFSSFNNSSSHTNGQTLKWAALSLGHRHILYLLPEKKGRMKFSQISVDDTCIDDDQANMEYQNNKLVRHSVAEFPPRNFQMNMHDPKFESAICVLL